jgi:hypothetical protein
MKWPLVPVTAFLLIFPCAASAKVALKPAPQLWVYAAKVDVESAKKLVQDNALDPEVLGRALFNSLRRYKATEAEAHLSIARLFLSRGADPNYKAPNGQTPLMAASGALAEPIVRLLLENGAQVASKDAQGKTAEDYAKRGGGKQEGVLALLGSPPKANPLMKEIPKPKPEIQNLGMEESGSDIVFSYDLVAAEPACIKVIGSLDNGATYDMAIKTISGDLGKGISEGKGKRIVWNMGKDYPKGLPSDNVLVDVIAERCP